MGCSILDGFVKEQMDHRAEYTDEYWDLDDDELEHMTYDEEREMLADQAGEERWQDDLSTRQGKHLKNCKDHDCIYVCGNWREDHELSKYV